MVSFLSSMSRVVAKVRAGIGTETSRKSFMALVHIITRCMLETQSRILGKIGSVPDCKIRRIQSWGISLLLKVVIGHHFLFVVGLRFMSDINQPSLPTPFYSVLVSQSTN